MGKLQLKSKGKEILIFALFFLTLLFVFLKNAEHRLTVYYRDRGFSGEIRVTGFAPYWQGRLLKWKVNYVYSEKVDGRTYQVPLSKSFNWAQAVLPDVNEEDPQVYWIYSEFDHESRETLLPIFIKGVSLRPDFQQQKQALEGKLQELPLLKGQKVQVHYSQGQGYFLGRGYISLLPKPGKLNYILWQQKEKGQRALGGSYEISFQDALRTQLIYVEISGSQGADFDIEDAERQLKEFLDREGLPDGHYQIDNKTETGGYIDYRRKESGEV